MSKKGKNYIYELVHVSNMFLISNIISNTKKTKKVLTVYQYCGMNTIFNSIF